MPDAERNSTIAKYLLAIAASATITIAGVLVITWRDVGFNTRSLEDLESATARAITRLESDVRSLDATVGVVASQAHENAIYRRQQEKEADACAARIRDLERDFAGLRPRTEKPESATDAERAEIRQRLERLEQGSQSDKR